mmetsp:Transcript_20284/g.56430  ORF Transcript_20284/g.56430 Transcript_20284/m.56430 type:complete len:86 (+) Transcript_20284:1169-1426(+)
MTGIDMVSFPSLRDSSHCPRRQNQSLVEVKDRIGDKQNIGTGMPTLHRPFGIVWLRKSRHSRLQFYGKGRIRDTVRVPDRERNSC